MGAVRTFAPIALDAVPPDISDRQFFQQLALDGDITQDEALAAVTVGAMPKAIASAVAQLPAGQQFPAKMALCGATLFERATPFVGMLGPVLGKTPAQLDAIWRAAALL